jgi:hypothetical protein
MTLSRRQLLTTGLGVAVTAGLAGCAGLTGQTGGDQGSGSDEQVTLTFVTGPVTRRRRRSTR